MPSGWTGINEGVDTGNDVEAKLTTAFNNIDTDVSTLGSELNQKEDVGAKSTIQHIPQDPSSVPYVRGTTYYNGATGTLDIKGEYPDVTLQIGNELHMEVFNNSGSTIPNGTPVRHNGVATATPPNGSPTAMPQVLPAQANSFTNARILGVTTHDIPTGQTGIITTFGEVSGVDTSSFATGVPLYLSDTVAGGITETPPDILTQVGGALTQDALTGRLFVSLENTINLPVTIGSLGRQTAITYSLNGTSTNIDNFTQGGEVIDSVTPVAGTITIANEGWYEFTFSMSGAVDDEEEDVFFELYDATNAVILSTRRVNSGRSSTPSDVAFSPSFTTLVEITSAPASVLIRARTDGTNLDMDVDTMQFYSKSIHIR